MLQVAVHTDEQDMAALFLYRKLSKEPMQAPLSLPGPAVEATDAEMQVSSLNKSFVSNLQAATWIWLMSLVTLYSHPVGHVTAPSGQHRCCMSQWLVLVEFFAPLLSPHVTQGSLCPDQAWLEDFLAKEKEVAGVKEEPKEAEGEAAAAESTAAAAEKAEGAAAPHCFHNLKLALHSWCQL